MIEDIHVTLKSYYHEDAVIYCDESYQIQKLKYQEVEKISYIFFENLKYLKKGSTCFALLMHHNMFIPSLAFSLQRLNCPFLFLEINQIKASELIHKAGVKYIIVHNVECYIPKAEFVFSISIDLNNTYDIYMCNNIVCIYEGINYIVQTSGTTNVQKIVRVEHECIKSNIICLRNRLRVTHLDTIYYGTPLTFDPSIVELYLAITTGAKLLIVSRAIKENPSLLYKILFQTMGINITVLQMCPSVFLQWCRSDLENVLQNSHLRILLLGGECFPTVLQTLKKSRNLKMYNIYGITELSCWAYLAEINEDEISLGDILDDTIFEVKDDNGETITDGEGELCLGSSLRICYLDDEQPNTITRPLMRKTGDLVVVKGNKIMYKSRCDNVIKRFGYRVNLVYVENIVHSSTGLRCVCVWLETKRKLILYVAINETDAAIVSRIKDKLKIKMLHILPKECMPDFIELLSSIPLTQNGKVDRAILLQEADTLLNETIIINECLLKLFKSLWFKYFGGHSNEMVTKTFYDLGGTSIMRMQFLEELNQNYDGLLPPSILDYIFTNMYGDVCNFLERAQINEKKRKVDSSLNINNHNKMIKGALRIEWNYDFNACVDSTPVILRKNRFVAVGAFSNIFAVLSISTGEEVAKLVLPNAIESSCLVSDCENYLYIGCYDHNMYCIDARTSKIAWMYSTGDRIKNKPIFLDSDTIIFGSYDKNLHCINSKDGRFLWKVDTYAAVTSAALLIDYRIIITTIKGSCLCLNKCGNIIWQINLDCPLFGSPIRFGDGFVIADVLGTVHCISLSSEKLWEIKVEENIYSSVLLLGNYLIFGTHQSNIYCFEYSSYNLKPELKHKIPIDSATSSTATTLVKDDETYVVAACISGYVYVINTNDFSITSKLKVNGDIFSSPAVIEDNIFIGCRDNNLICIKVR